MRQVKFQQLRKDGLDVQSKAQEKVGVGQTDVAIEMLQDYLTSLDKEQIDPQQADPAPQAGRDSACRSSRSSRSKRIAQAPDDGKNDMIQDAHAGKDDGRGRTRKRTWPR